MVALLIGLLVLLAVVQVFVVGKRSFDQVDELSRRQEGIRFFSDIFTMHVRSSSSIKEVSAGGDCLSLDFSTPVFHGDFCSSDTEFSIHYIFINDGVVMLESCPSDFADYDEYLAFSCSAATQATQDGIDAGSGFFEEYVVAREVSGDFSPRLFDSAEPQGPINTMGVDVQIQYSATERLSALSVDFSALNRRNLIYHAVVKAKENSL